MPNSAILYYDCSAGISGDMHLGAMVDLGVPAEHLETELGKLGLSGWQLRFTRDQRGGIGGTRADVLLEAAMNAPSLCPDSNANTDSFRPVTMAAAPWSAHHSEHEHRRHRDIVAIIEASALAEGAKRRALAIFGKLAEAEGKIHGLPPEEVAFHEVGALDSIIDIVGAAVALEWLQPARILVSTIELGGGYVRCTHGRLPVPAPATADILRGVPTRLGTVPFEATTPTGAAILAACADEYTDRAEFTIQRIGYGIGHRQGPIPNLLRVFLANGTQPPATASDIGAHREPAVVIECNIDDMTGEVAGHVLELLLAAGAADAWVTPIVMKKSRPAICFSVLCDLSHEAQMIDLLLRETSTFGLRRREVGKLALERRISEVATPLGPVRVKTAWLDGRQLKSKPEYEDLRRLAASHGRPLCEVERMVAAVLAQSAPQAH
jgi:uncharacterized protein (TIGR00299 family) protein